jgi:hypothetical protein
MTGVALLFTVGKGPGDIPKMQSQTQLSFHPRPLIWGMPPPRAFTFNITFGMLWGCCDEERSRGPQYKRWTRYATTTDHKSHDGRPLSKVQ